MSRPLRAAFCGAVGMVHVRSSNGPPLSFPGMHHDPVADRLLPHLVPDS